MDLQQKLLKLKEKQAAVEAQIAAQKAAQDAVAAIVFKSVLETHSNALQLAKSAPVVQSLSVKDKSLFSAWLKQLKVSTTTTSNA